MSHFTQKWTIKSSQNLCSDGSEYRFLSFRLSIKTFGLLPLILIVKIIWLLSVINNDINVKHSSLYCFKDCVQKSCFRNLIKIASSGQAKILFKAGYVDSFTTEHSCN